MGVARRHGIANAEQLEAAAWIADHRLRHSADELVVGQFPEVAGVRLEVVVDVIQRDGAVVDDHLVDQAFLVHAAVIAANVRDQFVAAALDRVEPVGNREGDIGLLQGAHVRTRLIAMISGENERSGVLISRLAPVLAMNSAACSPGWSPASSKISTFLPGLISPEMISRRMPPAHCRC